MVWQDSRSNGQRKAVGGKCPNELDSRRRSAFTLVEVLLVLSVLVAATAIVLPDALAWQSRWELRDATRSLQTALQSVRTRAIESGETHVLRFELNGTRYSIQAESGGSSPASMSRNAISGREDRGDWEDALPLCCRFAGASREIATHQANAARFHPDGTADATRILVADDSENVLVLQIDRLTGACEIVVSE